MTGKECDSDIFIWEWGIQLNTPLDKVKFGQPDMISNVSSELSQVISSFGDVNISLRVLEDINPETIWNNDNTLLDTWCSEMENGYRGLSYVWSPYGEHESPARVREVYTCDMCNLHVGSAQEDHFRDHMGEQLRKIDQRNICHKSWLDTYARKITDPGLDSTCWQISKDVNQIQVDEPVNDYQNHPQWPICFRTRIPDRASQFVTAAVLLNAQPDTYSAWVLECKEYRSWYEQPEGLLWVSGSAGTGKSTALAAIIGQLEGRRTPDEHIVSCLLNPDVKSWNPSITMLGHIITKLLARETADHSDESLRRHMRGLMQEGSSLSISGMARIESSIRHSLKQQETLLIVIDGLDEFDHISDQQEMCIQLVERLCHSSPKHHIKCIVSGRSLYRPKIKGLKKTWQICLDDKPEHQASLKQYVWDHFPLSDLRFIESLQHLGTAIAEKAGSTFLWARIILQELCLLMEAGEQISSSDEITQIIYKLPQGLDNLYGKFFLRIEGQHESAALSMLRWVTFAARPLQADELLGGLYIETGIVVKRTEISTISGGLVQTEKNGTIRLLHPSLRIYLQTRMINNWRHVSNEANEILAHVCLRGMRGAILLKSLNLVSESFSAKTDLDENTPHLHAFQKYARNHWIFHYRLAEASSAFLAGFLHNTLEVNIKATSSSLPRRNLDTSHTTDSSHLRQNRLAKHFQYRSELLFDPYSIGLMVAARFGFPKLAKLELEMGVDPGLIHEAEKRTPLVWAALNGNEEVVKLLIQHETDLKYVKRSGEVAFLCAVASGHIEIATSLLLSQDWNEPQETRAAMGSISIKTSFHPSCKTCGELEIVQILCPSSEFSELRRSSLEAHPGLKASWESSFSFQWPLGVRMRRALEIALKLGIDDVIKLLKVVGNDTAGLELAVRDVYTARPAP